MTWATKLGGNSTPTINLPTHSRAVIPQIFHTVANDTAAPLPFDNPPHLQLTWRFLAYNFPKYEIMFKQIFPGGDLVTRDCLLRFHTTASDQVRNNLGVTLKLDDHGDPITVVTRRTTNPLFLNVGHHGGCKNPIPFGGHRQGGLHPTTPTRA
jgi:hypothetical protein